ncbi:MAG: metallophosphoesterase family protein [Pseudomonadota bacterium]
MNDVTLESFSPPITQDLGEFDRPVLVFGGPYSNLEASRALLEEVARLGIPSDHVICTGDIVAYCGNPRETVDLMKESGFHFIQGNCEENLSNAIDDCGCGFDEGSECAILSDKWYALAQAATTAEQKDWMGTLPHRIAFTYAGKRFHVLHGSNRDISEFIFPSTDPERKAAIIEETGADVVIAGHSGMPFTQEIGDKIWHNAGVIGLPPNDGTPKVWYSIIEMIDGELIFHHRALDYDHEAAAETMRGLGLLEYADALVSGIYPSQSILPADEIGKTGQAIPTSSVRVTLQDI